jgi:hypothetical protein
MASIYLSRPHSTFGVMRCASITPYLRCAKAGAARFASLGFVQRQKPPAK